MVERVRLLMAALIALQIADAHDAKVGAPNMTSRDRSGPRKARSQAHPPIFARICHHG